MPVVRNVSSSAALIPRRSSPTPDRLRCRALAERSRDADLDRKAVRIAAGNDVGRERLVRDCTRPPFAVDRIEVLRDGRVAYAIKAPRRGRTHRVMAPRRIHGQARGVHPPPKIPFVRHHGVFASRSSWRALVTPKPPAHASKPKTCEQSTSAALSPAALSPAPISAPPVLALSPPLAPPAPLASTDAALAVPVVHVEPTISVAHWGRLGDGELLARSRHSGP